MPLLVKAEVTLRLALTHYEQVLAHALIRIHQRTYIYITEYIHIERQNWLVRRPCLTQSATGVQQRVSLIADSDLTTKIVMLTQVLDDLIREMVHIDHYIRNTGLAQPHYLTLQQRMSTYGHQRLRHRVRQWFEASSQTRSEDHCSHINRLFLDKFDRKVTKK